eukprot:768091-Hanusia_phi.AAC.1
MEGSEAKMEGSEAKMEGGEALKGEVNVEIPLTADDEKRDKKRQTGKRARKKQQYALMIESDLLAETAEALAYVNTFKSARDASSAEGQKYADMGNGEHGAKIVVAQRFVCTSSKEFFAKTARDLAYASTTG